MNGAIPISKTAPAAPPVAELTDDGAATSIDRSALLRGDATAVEALYRELFEPVYAFVYWRVGGVQSDAEDVTQETFVTAFASIARFEGRSSLYSWICGIARNLAHARLRARGRLVADGGEETAAAQETAAAPPDVELERAQTEVLVGRALTELPPHYQQSLLDKYVRQLSFAEIAAERGGTAKAVESTIQRAKRALGQALARVGIRRADGGGHG